jgi:Alpha-glucuronidase
MRKITFLLIVVLSVYTYAENGSRLWLPEMPKSQESSTNIQQISTIDIARAELSGIKNVKIGTLLDKEMRGLFTQAELKSLGKESYFIRTINGLTVICGGSEIGALYGAYHLLRLSMQQQNIENLNIKESPAYDLRLLNHWNNLNGTIERGYAGRSLWKWDELPDVISPRYREYARANASIGINGSVLNNVNASPDILKNDYLQKVKVIADIFRPYGVKVYLSVNFSSPKILGGLADSDPLNAEVQKWWKDKVKEIYKIIPDFGGFLVKANSEGQPGPHDYGRTHADGANMLAKALKPYKGVVMWRAFVYAPDSKDRAKQAYDEFMPFDGKFLDNVIIQVKNGPVDFQPREPFTPLFGAMQKTPLMVEFQITQEYLGFSNHLVYLAPLFKECLDSDTYCNGEGSTIAKITDGTIRPAPISAIAGVSNIGEDANWTGHHFAQSNWYSFGRLAWNYSLSSDEIADEWIRLTFSNDTKFVEPVKEMMLSSREAAVDYMMPLGIHHIFAEGHHYGPQPWHDKAGREDWTAYYYHKSDNNGIGFDRTTNGSNAVSQYFSPLSELYNDPATCPDIYLLWFHHLPWTYKMKNGESLWNNLCYSYDRGVQKVREFQKVWDMMENHIDEERFKHVQSRLKIQSRDAVWWKDACLLYFQTFSKMPIPYDIERPVNELDDLKKIKLDMRHHN